MALYAGAIGGGLLGTTPVECAFAFLTVLEVAGDKAAPNAIRVARQRNNAPRELIAPAFLTRWRSSFMKRMFSSPKTEPVQRVMPYPARHSQSLFSRMKPYEGRDPVTRTPPKTATVPPDIHCRSQGRAIRPGDLPKPT